MPSFDGENLGIWLVTAWVVFVAINTFIYIFIRRRGYSYIKNIDKILVYFVLPYAVVFIFAPFLLTKLGMIYKVVGVIASVAILVLNYFLFVRNIKNMNFRQ